MAEIDYDLNDHEFTLRIELGNDAFNEATDAAYIEIARILRHAAAKIEQGQTDVTLYDVNGNKVGECEIVELGDPPDPNDCAECGRSRAHYTGPCDH